MSLTRLYPWIKLLLLALLVLAGMQISESLQHLNVVIAHCAMDSILRAPPGADAR
jgi:hypothetical protein